MDKEFEEKRWQQGKRLEDCASILKVLAVGCWVGGIAVAFGLGAIGILAVAIFAGAFLYAFAYALITLGHIEENTRIAAEALGKIASGPAPEQATTRNRPGGASQQP